MKAVLVSVFVTMLMVVAIGGTVAAQGENDDSSLKDLVCKIDYSISSLRKGDNSGAMALISSASALYNEKFNSRVAEKDNELDNRIRTAFQNLSSSLSEENQPQIFQLRSDVLAGAEKIGVSISPFYGLSMFIILFISIVVSFLVTLLNKKMVNWKLVREARIKLAEFQEQYKEASRKKDMKLMHKLQLKQGEIMRLQGDVMKQTMKPTLIYMIPLFVLWYLLLGAYSGWVVAWLPFRVDLPFLGPIVVFGVGWWYFITYLGFSQIFRKIIIRD